MNSRTEQMEEVYWDKKSNLHTYTTEQSLLMKHDDDRSGLNESEESHEEGSVVLSLNIDQVEKDEVLHFPDTKLMYSPLSNSAHQTNTYFPNESDEPEAQNEPRDVTPSSFVIEDSDGNRYVRSLPTAPYRKGREQPNEFDEPETQNERRDVTPSSFVIEDSDGNRYVRSLPTAPYKKGRGRPRKAETVKRRMLKSSPPAHVKKKQKHINFPLPMGSKEKSANLEALDKIDALSLALAMGYTNPHEKTGVINENQSGKEVNNDQEEEEMSKKISPVENIQQVIDYKKSSTCSCLCSLTVRDIASHRLETAGLDRQSRDFFIMGLFRSSAVPSPVTSKNCDRQRYRFNYRILNTRICQICFLFVNNIGAKYMKNLKKHFNEHGVKSRTHGNQGRKPHHALRTDDVDDVAEFIIRYAAIHGAPAPRPPKNAKAKRIIRLPPSETFTSVYKQYKEFCNHTGKRGIAASTFRKIWSTHAAHVKVIQQNSPKDVASSVTAQSGVQAASAELSNKDASLHPQEHETIKKMLKTKVKDMPSKAIALPPQQHHTHTEVAQHVQVSMPFDFGTMDLPQTPVMPIGMYLNDGAVNTDNSWQHNLLLPHGSITHSHHAPQSGLPSHAPLCNNRQIPISRPIMQTTQSNLSPSSSHMLSSQVMHDTQVVDSSHRKFTIQGQNFPPAPLHGHQW